ncbi:MAG: carboxypeptidase regulatory-like domain-containing protein [Elusimicrobiota bacterium]
MPKSDKKQADYCKKNSGFTYLEIVLFLALVSYIVITFAQLIMKVNVSEKTSQDMSVASNFARSQLEQLRATPFYFIGESSGTFFDNNKKYDWLVEVWFMTEEFGKLAVAPDTTDLKMANVVLKWFDSAGEKTYSMSSLFANYSGLKFGSCSVSGRVTTTASGGIENGFVEIPGTIFNTYTGCNGAYKLNFLPSGSFRVVASGAGYQTKEIVVENLGFSEARNDVNFLLAKIEK